MLYEKYRPRKFEDVIGQSHVVNMLRGALRSGKPPNAILFCGPHGIGKTTIARIFAKVVNCEKFRTTLGSIDTLNESIDPCCECASCQLIDDGSHSDVCEIDAASKTGIDDVRSIIESCAYMPLILPFKVFIMDEMHMLSSSAVSALLKIVESPPPHVVFLFVTTDKKKLPLPILSRCQIMLLRRLAPEFIEQKLNQICLEQEIESEPGGIAALARSCGGSLRDSIVALEQCNNFAISTGSRIISENIVKDVLLCGDYDFIQSLLVAILSWKPKEVLIWAETSFNAGVDMVRAINEAQRILSYFIVAKVLGYDEFAKSAEGNAWLSLSYLQNSNIKSLFDFTTIDDLDRAWSMLASGQDFFRANHDIYPTVCAILIRVVSAHSLGSALNSLNGEIINCNNEVSNDLLQNICTQSQCDEPTKKVVNTKTDSVNTKESAVFKNEEKAFQDDVNNIPENFDSILDEKLDEKQTKDKSIEDQILSEFGIVD